jgi:predicted HTH domain antitoxin
VRVRGMEAETIRVEVELPKTFSLTIKVKEKELNKFIREALAVELYRERKVSLGKAAEIAGARNKWEMLMILNKRGVAIDYTAEDAEKDLEALNKVLERR